MRWLVQNPLARPPIHKKHQGVHLFKLVLQCATTDASIHQLTATTTISQRTKVTPAACALHLPDMASVSQTIVFEPVHLFSVTKTPGCT